MCCTMYNAYHPLLKLCYHMFRVYSIESGVDPDEIFGGGPMRGYLGEDR